MSDEFESHSENNFSAFWPLLIVISALFIWALYQDWAANSQRNVYATQFEAAKPTIEQAQNVANRYVALMKDLVETSQKDPAAADIVKAAISAGLIHVQPKDTNAPAATPPPAPAK